MRLKSSICWRNSLGSIEVKASTLDRAMGVFGDCLSHPPSDLLVMMIVTVGVTVGRE